MVSIDFTPRRVCSRSIHVDLDDAGQVVEGFSFVGGCNGNLKAISKLVKGMPVEQVIAVLDGNTCGAKPTSCADQLCRALEAARAQAQA